MTAGLVLSGARSQPARGAYSWEATPAHAATNSCALLRACACRYQHEGVREFEWRAGYKLRPYIFDAIRLVDSLPPEFFPSSTKPEGLEFVHFPIVDCATAHDASVLQLAVDLVARLSRGGHVHPLLVSRPLRSTLVHFLV